MPCAPCTQLLTSETSVLMTPIAVVWEWDVLMSRVTIVTKHRRPKGLVTTWPGFYTREVRRVNDSVQVWNLHKHT